MTVDRTEGYMIGLLHELCNLPQETEWVEFKLNKASIHSKTDEEEIGEYISALANSAALLGKVNAYMVFRNSFALVPIQKN